MRTIRCELGSLRGDAAAQLTERGAESTGGSASSPRRSTAGSRGSTGACSPRSRRRADDDADRREARQARRHRSADARAGQATSPARARPAPAEGSRRLRRAAAREPAPRPPAGDGVHDAVPLQLGGARRRGRQGRAARSRSTRSSRSTTSSGWPRPPATRRAALCEGVRAGRQVDRSTTSPTSTFARTRARSTSPSCTCRSSRYYELACNPAAGLLEYANERRVFPVSPKTFTAYLQLIVLGMRSMQVEERAHEVMAYVAGLRQRLRTLQGRVRARRQASGPCADHLREGRQAARSCETKLDRAIEDDDVSRARTRAARDRSGLTC